MAGSVLLDDFQQQHLVIGDREFGQCEYRPLPLVPPHDGRIIADAQDFEHRLLLRRALGEFAICYDEPPRIHLEGDIRIVIHTSMYVNDIVGNINSQHLDPDAVLFRANALHIRTVLPVYVAQHAFYGRGFLTADLAQQHPPLVVLREMLTPQVVGVGEGQPRQTAEDEDVADAGQPVVKRLAA